MSTAVGGAGTLMVTVCMVVEGYRSSSRYEVQTPQSHQGDNSTEQWCYVLTGVQVNWTPVSLNSLTLTKPN